jgi:GT2 family glycosyltransferase
MTPTMPSTIVICTRHRPDDLRRTLESVAAQHVRPEAVVIVDDSDPHLRAETEAIARASTCDPVVLVKDHPGLTASRNLALDHVQTPLITFLDDDVVLDRQYLQAVNDAFTRDDAIAGVGGVVDNDHVYGHRRARALLGLPGAPTGKVLPTGYTAPLPTAAASVEHLIGCNMTFRTDVVRAYRFDTERFSGYALGEDAELTHRMFLNGCRLEVVPDAHLQHLSRPVRHDRQWGRRELAVRPHLAHRRFSKWRFLVAALAVLAHSAVTNPARALGNLEGIIDVLTGRHDNTSWQKPTAERKG